MMSLFTIVANPATSHWALIPKRVTLSPSPDRIVHASPLIIYDPTMSLHFRLTIAPCYKFVVPPDKSRLRFHIYSSETSSWSVSSFCPRGDSIFDLIPSDSSSCQESRIGGGSVCWKGGYNNLMGYEIASDTYWMIPLPLPNNIIDVRYSCHCQLLGRDGKVYCVVFYCKNMIVNVQRLDEKKSWVLEGEGNFEELKKLMPSFLYPHACYDGVRKVLFIALHRRNELIAFHLSSSRIEVLCQDDQGNCGYQQVKLAHANTLACFYGGRQDNYALDKLLRDES